MDEYTADAFANHDESTPSVSVTTAGDEKAQESETAPEKLRNKVSAGYLKEKIQDLAPHRREKPDPSSGLSLQDRLLAKCVTRFKFYMSVTIVAS
jgi:hypothetical protein